MVYTTDLEETHCLFIHKHTYIHTHTQTHTICVSLYREEESVNGGGCLDWVVLCPWCLIQENKHIQIEKNKAYFIKKQRDR